MSEAVANSQILVGLEKVGKPTLHTPHSSKSGCFEGRKRGFGTLGSYFIAFHFNLILCSAVGRCSLWCRPWGRMSHWRISTEKWLSMRIHLTCLTSFVSTNPCRDLLLIGWACSSWLGWTMRQHCDWTDLDCGWSFVSPPPGALPRYKIWPLVGNVMQGVPWSNDLKAKKGKTLYIWAHTIGTLELLLYWAVFSMKWLAKDWMHKNACHCPF